MQGIHIGFNAHKQSIISFLKECVNLIHNRLQQRSEKSKFDKTLGLKRQHIISTYHVESTVALAAPTTTV